MLQNICYGNILYDIISLEFFSKNLYFMQEKRRKSFSESYIKSGPLTLDIDIPALAWLSPLLSWCVHCAEYLTALFVY